MTAMTASDKVNAKCQQAFGCYYLILYRRALRKLARSNFLTKKQHVCLGYYENYRVAVFAAETSRFERFATKSSTFRL